MNRRNLFLFILFIFQSLGAIELMEIKNDNGFSVRVNLSKENLSLFDSVRLTLKLTYPSSYKPDLKSLEENLFSSDSFIPSAFTVTYEKPLPEKELSAQIKQQEITLVLHPRIAGSHSLLFNPITFTSTQMIRIPIVLSLKKISIAVEVPKDFIPLEKYTPRLLNLSLNLPIDITGKEKVNLLLKNQTELKEKEHNLKLFNQKSMPWISLCILGILLIGLIYFSFNPKLIRKTFINQVEPSPQAKALKNLDLLAQRNLPSQKRFNEFYTELKKIFDDFLNSQYQLTSFAMAMEELINKPYFNKIISDLQSPWISEWVQKTNLIKYGEYMAEENESLEDLKRFRNLFRRLA